MVGSNGSRHRKTRAYSRSRLGSGMVVGGTSAATGKASDDRIPGTPSPSACAPDVILASASTSVAALQQTTRTVPIVFVNVIDPVGAGFVASLARPGGNSTGFTLFEYSLSGKWLELFKEIAPNLTRIAILRDLRRCMGRPSQHTLSKVLSVALCDRAAG